MFLNHEVEKLVSGKLPGSLSDSTEAVSHIMNDFERRVSFFLVFVVVPEMPLIVAYYR